MLGFLTMQTTPAEFTAIASCEIFEWGERFWARTTCFILRMNTFYIIFLGQTKEKRSAGRRAAAQSVERKTKSEFYVLVFESCWDNDNSPEKQTILQSSRSIYHHTQSRVNVFTLMGGPQQGRLNATSHSRNTLKHMTAVSQQISCVGLEWDSRLG